jgi:hypothetical protein
MSDEVGVALSSLIGLFVPFTFGCIISVDF